MHANTVAVNLAKSVFQIAVADGQWRIMERHRLIRMQKGFTTALDDAGNSSGSSSVVRSDWHSGVADSMSARDIALPLQMPAT